VQVVFNTTCIFYFFQCYILYKCGGAGISDFYLNTICDMSRTMLHIIICDMSRTMLHIIICDMSHVRSHIAICDMSRTMLHIIICDMSHVRSHIAICDMSHTIYNLDRTHRSVSG